jgi:hypothetical protein
VRLIKRTFEAYFASNGEIAVRLIKRTYEAYFVSNGETVVRLIKICNDKP